LLRAAVAIGGRALTLYEEVHPLHRLGNPRVQRLFLSQLKALLPEGTLPIIVTDAGFRTPWFRAVASLGWHWIGRVRNRVHVRPLGTARWVSSKSVYPKAHARAQALGAYELAQTNALACNLYLIQHRKKHRIRKSAYGQPLRSSANQARARMHREPWLLAASPSLSAMSANQIVRCYAQRMQIEEAFRDLKSTRYGLGFELHLSRCCSSLRWRFSCSGSSALRPKLTVYNATIKATPAARRRLYQYSISPVCFYATPSTSVRRPYNCACPACNLQYSTSMPYDLWGDLRSGIQWL
jgi:hypothetical protein